MTEGTQALIEARDVVVRRGARAVVDGVSIAVGRGELVALVGPNGAGKTTLMRALAGVQDIDGGEIFVNGVAFKRLATEARIRAIGYLPQTRDVHWPMAVRDIVVLGQPGETLLRGEARLADSAESVMRQFDVGHLAARRVTELSGGELARVLLARAVLQGGSVLIADEPAAGLDLKHRLGLMQTLKSRILTEGKAGLVSVHDLGLAVRYADRIVVMDQGRIVASGRAGETLTSDVLRRVWDVEGDIRTIGGIPVLVARTNN